MFTRSALCLSLAAILLAGCGANKEAALVGKWKGDMKMSAEDEKNPMAAMAKSMMGNLSIEFKKDHNFTMTMIFPVEGTWALEGDTVKCTPTKMMGMTIDDVKKQQAVAAKSNPTLAKAQQDPGKTLELKESADGKTLTMVDTTGKSKSALTFTKESGS